ncbi:MAG: hypothetical protein HYY85_12485 [Deltaproteobacteria bacterium]|nr:hypothetical protein [Deltaproteobacteria bacterium]
MILRRIPLALWIVAVLLAAVLLLVWSNGPSPSPEVLLLEAEAAPIRHQQGRLLGDQEASGGAAVLVPVGIQGLFLSSGALDLAGGQYIATFRLKALGHATGRIAFLDAYRSEDGVGGRLLESRELHAGELPDDGRYHDRSIELTHIGVGKVELRVGSFGAVPLAVDRILLCERRVAHPSPTDIRPWTRMPACPAP